MTYNVVDPLALQQSDLVEIRTAAPESPVFRGEVALVDAKNFYVSVRIEDTQTPIALSMYDWMFSVERPENFVPTADGLYVPEDADEGSAETIIRLFNGVFTNVITGDVIDVEDLPVLSPLRAAAPLRAAEEIPPVEEPVEEIPAIEPPAEEEPITDPEPTTEEPTP